MREILYQSVKENPKKLHEIVTYQSLKENPKGARDTNVSINKKKES